MNYKKQAIVYVTKEFTFDSCHNLLEYDGACANLHGHTYKLQVTLKGKKDEKGMLLDFNYLKKDIKNLILDTVDHNYLNDLFVFNTTAENMVVWIYDMLTELYSNSTMEVYEIKLWETPTSYATYRGEIEC